LGSHLISSRASDSSPAADLVCNESASSSKRSRQQGRRQTSCIQSQIHVVLRVDRLSRELPMQEAVGADWQGKIASRRP
jgi:hypothetical protein